MLVSLFLATSSFGTSAEIATLERPSSLTLTYNVTSDTPQSTEYV